MVNAIAEIQSIVGALHGVRGAPTEPPEQMSVFPFVVCYPRRGRWQQYTPETKRGTHEIAIEVHLPRGQELARAVAAAMGYADSVPNALMRAMRGGALQHIQAFGDIEYTFGPLGWGGLETIGWRFVMTNVVLETIIA